MSLIVEMTCVQGTKEPKVVMGSTNLGNCRVCEWEDYFEPSGRFLGSTLGKFGASNFNPKPVAKDFYRTNGIVVDESGRPVETASVKIDRGPR